MAEAESLETAAEHERILREIESTDTACIGPTLRYPGCGGHGPAGTGGTGGGQAPSGPCVWIAARWASAGPSLWRVRRATSTFCEAGLPPQPRRGVLSRWPAHSSVTLTAPFATLRAGAAFVLPSRRARLRATRARRTDGGSYSKPIFPRRYHPSPSDANPVLS